jgi:hypothetical protein
MSIGGGAGALLIGLVSLSTVCGGTLPPPAPPRTAQPAPAPAAPQAAPLGEARVSGRLLTHDGRQLLSGAVILRSIEDEPPAQVPSEDVTIAPDGTFEFRNVPPGQYEVRARGLTQPNSIGLFAKSRITVDGADAQKIVLTLVPGATAGGVVIVESRQSSKPPALDALLVRAPLTDGSSFGDALTGHPDAQRQFAIHGLMPGGHVIRLQGLQDPWVLKSVVLRGRDITDAGFEAESGERIRDLRVTITDVASELTGTVRDAQGQVSANATVLVVPLSPQSWTRSSRRLVVLRTDASGRYRIRGLPAGEYRAIASAALDEANAFRRDVLREVVATGVPLSLEPLQARVLDLQLIQIGPTSAAEPGF